jgi:ribosomal protein S18 acetylase RimI-like enzyme
MVFRIGMPTAALALGFAASWRILRFLRWIDRRREELIPTAHWYLLNLAVRPELQGEGLGSALLLHGVNRARQQGLPCFLETANGRNLPFYEKHGFRMVYEEDPPGGAPRIWGFQRIYAGLAGS